MFIYTLLKVLFLLLLPIVIIFVVAVAVYSSSHSSGRSKVASWLSNLTLLKKELNRSNHFEQSKSNFVCVSCITFKVCIVAPVKGLIVISMLRFHD